MEHIIINEPSEKLMVKPRDNVTEEAILARQAMADDVAEQIEDLLIN